MTRPTWAMPALVIMSLWGVGHTVVIYLAGLQDVDPGLRVTSIDGGMGDRRDLAQGGKNEEFIKDRQQALFIQALQRHAGRNRGTFRVPRP